MYNHPCLYKFVWTIWIISPVTVYFMIIYVDMVYFIFKFRNLYKLFHVMHIYSCKYWSLLHHIFDCLFFLVLALRTNLHLSVSVISVIVLCKLTPDDSSSYFCALIYLNLFCIQVICLVMIRHVRWSLFTAFLTFIFPRLLDHKGQNTIWFLHRMIENLYS